MLSRRIFAAVAMLCAFSAPVYAQKTKAQLASEIANNFPDNTVGAITPAGLRAVTLDTVNSIMPTAPVGSGNLACFNGTTGLLRDCGSAPGLGLSFLVGPAVVYSATQTVSQINRSNAGSTMVDQLPGTGTGVLPARTQINVTNSDATALLQITPATGANLDGSPTKFIPLGPGQSAAFVSDGTGYYTVSAPARAKLPPNIVSTLYVATTGGSDTTSCISLSAPCATLQYAADLMYQKFDLGEGQLTIQALTPGTFNITGNAVYLRGRPPGLGNPSGVDPIYHAVQFRGDPATPGNFVINATGNCFTAINSTTYAIDGFKLGSCGGVGIFAGSGSILGIEHIEYGTAGSAHVQADGLSSIHFDNSYTISGSSPYHMVATNLGYIISNGAAQTVTLTGTPAFATAFVSAQSGGIVNTAGFSYSGAASGTRWSTGPYAGVINNTFGTACDSIFPGSVAGSNTGGGQCGTSDTTYSNLTLSGLTANTLLRLDANKKAASVAAVNNGVVVTDGSGIPSTSTTLPTGLALQTPASGNGSNLTALNATQLTTGTVPMARINLSQITASLGADVPLNNTGTYFDGPSIAQGSTGTWFASGTVTVLDTTGAARIDCKLWDGTTVIASSESATQGAAAAVSIGLSGYLATPAGNLRISCKDIANTTGNIKFNYTGNSKDSTISAFRIN